MIEDFEKFLKNNLPQVDSFHPDFNQALGEILDAGGKRFRPLLLLSVVQNTAPLLVKNAMHVALGVEMLHTYSLVHDDLPSMDDASFRRGHPTLHVTYDEVTAILVGDALNTHAFYMLANAPLSDEVKVKLISILARDGGISGMIIGQAIDCKFENKKLTLEQLKFLHVNKTAKLIAASLLMGAVIGGLDEIKQKVIYDFGLKLGLLFQVQDDIIDATQSSDEAGKPTGNDEHKNSFVNLLGVDGASREKSRLIKELNNDTSKLDGNLAKVLQKIISDYFKG
ncbi:MAG TPA: polyprenyl synthetase family protein [Sulfurospirillum arcachonense]|nr:polyprenyl synthetase family protein [Sulfurospirillum arcachonense]HIP45326.1 polyprenyl synthetase family protein [Sulfurospirillum arcachonense]